MSKKPVSANTLAYREWLFKLLMSPNSMIGPMMKRMDRPHYDRAMRQGHVMAELITTDFAIMQHTVLTDTGRTYIMRNMQP